MSDLDALMLDMGRRARAAADALRATTPDARTEALHRLAEALRAAETDILSANARDVSRARDGGPACAPTRLELPERASGRRPRRRVEEPQRVSDANAAPAICGCAATNS